MGSITKNIQLSSFFSPLFLGSSHFLCVVKPVSRLTLGNTLKPRYNDPCNNKILAIKNKISSPFVLDFIVKIPCNKKNPAIKNKIFGPFRFVKLRFLCTKKNNLGLFFVYNPTLALLEGRSKDGCPLGVFGNPRITKIEL
jgi:hypothetical protein